MEKMRKSLGVVLVASPFVGITVAAGMARGWIHVLLAWAFALGILATTVVGVWLLSDD